MRALRLGILGAIALTLVMVALANRDLVILRLFPAEISALIGLDPQMRLPLYGVIFAAIVAGVLIGFVWEWLREHKHRAAAARLARKAEGLERELTRAGVPLPQAASAADDVLSLVDGPSRPAAGSALAPRAKGGA